MTQSVSLTGIDPSALPAVLYDRCYENSVIPMYTHPGSTRQTDFLAKQTLELFNVRSEFLLNATSTYYSQMDSLARRVDTFLDARVPESQSMSSGEVFSKAFDIAHRISSAVEGAFDGNTFTSEVIRYVDRSIVSNTMSRYRVYDIESGDLNVDSTMWYLYPVFLRHSQIMINESKSISLFRMITSVIQLLDDLSDLPEDVALGVSTPLTLRLYDRDPYHAKSIACKVSSALLRTSQKIRSAYTHELGEGANCLRLAELEHLAQTIRREAMTWATWEAAEAGLRKVRAKIPAVYCYAP